MSDAGRSARAALLAACDAIPTGRGYRFRPPPIPPSSGSAPPVNPRDPEHDGVSRDLVHRGEVVARAAGDGATYCCGVTFEAWWMAHQHAVSGASADEVRALITDWFCPHMGHGGAAAALVSRELGRAIARDDARAGDLCQFWRSVGPKPSGHSVVFLGWGDCGGQPVIRYWSSQPATGGVGVHEEVIGEGWQIHLARAHP